MPDQFIEPTRSIALRWGNYDDRYFAGLTLIVCSTIGLSGTNTYILPLLGLNTIAQCVGWWILPAKGMPRIWAIFPGMISMWLMLTGPTALWLLAGTYACWLWARSRPPASYLTVLFVLTAGILVGGISREYTGMPIAVPIMAVVIVGSAFIARGIARRQRTPSPIGAEVR